MNPPIQSEILPPVCNRPFCHHPSNTALRFGRSAGVADGRIPSTEINGFVGVDGGGTGGEWTWHSVWTRAVRRLRPSSGKDRLKPGFRARFTVVIAAVFGLVAVNLPRGRIEPGDAAGRLINEVFADRARHGGRPNEKSTTRNKTERLYASAFRHPPPAVYSRCPGTPARHKAARVSLIRVDRVSYTVPSIPPPTNPGSAARARDHSLSQRRKNDATAPHRVTGTRDTPAQTSLRALCDFGRKQQVRLPRRHLLRFELCAFIWKT